MERQYEGKKWKELRSTNYSGEGTQLCHGGTSSFHNTFLFNIHFKKTIQWNKNFNKRNTILESIYGIKTFIT